MATLRNKRKLAAISGKTQEDHPGNGQSRNTSVPGISEEYITLRKESEEIEGRFSIKLSQEFSKTELRILGALSKLDEFLLNPQIRTLSGSRGRLFVQHWMDPESRWLRFDPRIPSCLPKGFFWWSNQRPTKLNLLLSPCIPKLCSQKSQFVSQLIAHQTSLSVATERYQIYQIVKVLKVKF